MKQADKTNFYHYSPKLRLHARVLRSNMTKAEACLWKYVLKAGKMSGYKFRRQRPVLGYIADFMCKELLLVIEVDGVSHEFVEIAARDKIRQKRLEQAGFTVLRFTDDDVLTEIEGITNSIRQWIARRND